jgi:integrase-like protein
MGELRALLLRGGRGVGRVIRGRGEACGVYLHAHESVIAARHGIARYVQFFNTRRPHTALDCRTPDAVYLSSLPLAAAA